MENDNQNVQCLKSKKIFLNTIYLQIHIQKVHVSIQSNGCNICGIIIKHKRHYKRHIQEIHNKYKIKYTCKTCNKEYSRYNNLVLHMLIHENKTKICHICGKGFHRVDVMKKHIKYHL